MNVRRTASLVSVAAGLSLAATMAWGVPVLNGGWDTTASDASGYTDSITAANGLNVDGPYGYNLSGTAVFSITDVLALGDVWTVYDFGAPILTTIVQQFATGFGDNADADGYWTDATHSKGQVALAAGLHQITVSGDGAGGLPAHFYARIDSVPEPASLALLVGALCILVVCRSKAMRRPAVSP